MKKQKKLLIGIATGVILAVLFLFFAAPFLRTVPFPIPDSARWVRYKAAHVPGPGGEEWTRLHLPFEDCLSASEAILNDNIPPATIKHTEITKDSPVPRIDGPWWFTPHLIKNGTQLHRDINEPFSTTVWIDRERGIIYQHMSD